ncbi:unnamed protein product [Phytophthora fragariaefolia]|uniref:Unnamed protein product n=1 Tax=Phytophthora fragariaefolia TaxID=1490495 RepID=A0A9W6XGV4_9STRA|nr:unnamed protein product [Phytophthora fragariaefolia]
MRRAQSFRSTDSVPFPLNTNKKWASAASVKDLCIGIGGFEESIPHNEISSSPPPSIGPKRCSVSAEEDLALLHQAVSERPFLEERGKTMAAWGDIATQLLSDDSFSRDKLSRKNAEARFDKLVLQKRQQTATALAASGIDE